MSTEAPRSQQTVLLLGNYRLSVAIARQLGKAGHRVIAGGPSDTVIAQSRYVDLVWDHPSIFKNEKMFIDSLHELIADHPDLSLILPVSEPVLLKLLKMTDQLPLPLAAVDRKTVETCCNKGAMAQIAAELDVPQEPFAIVSSMEELLAAGDEVGYPFVARPNDTRTHDVKAHFVSSPRHLQHMFAEWPDRYESLLVQAHARGPRYNRYFVAEKGVILDSLDVKILRTDRADGSGYAVEGISVPSVPAMDAPSASLIGHLDYTGVGCIQYLFDETRGRLSFLEINPRLGGNYAFANSCGLDLVTPMLALALKQPLATGIPAAPHAVNKRYSWLYGDVIGLMGSVYKREIGWRYALGWAAKASRAAVRADTHLTFDRHDLGPSKWFAMRLVEAFLVILWDIARYIKRRISSVLRL